MNKILKYVLIGVGGIVFVLAAVAAYVAATFDPNDYKPRIVQLVKEKLDRTLRIDGDIKLTFFPALGADLGGLTLSEHAVEKEFASVEAARVAVQLMPLLAREVVVSRIEVRGLRASLVKHRDGTTNVDDLTGGEARKPKRTPGAEDRPAQRPIHFDIDHVLIENASLGYADERSGAKYALSKLTLKTGRIAAATPSDIQLAFAVGASQPGLNVDVRLKTRLAIDPGAQAFDLSNLAVDLAFIDPKSGRGPVAIKLTGSAHADIPKQRASLDFSTRVDESSITGKAGLAHFSPPSYVFDVNVDKLDADRYMGAKKPEGKSAPAGKPEEPLDFSALKTLKASGSVRIGSLKAANIKAQNVRLDARAGGGRLDLNPLSASLYQGTMSGSLSLVAAAAPQIAIKQKLADISIGPLLKDAIDRDLLEGKGNVALHVSGQGATVSAIKKALNGSASINLADGALKGINIAASIRNAKARLGALKGETTQAANAAEKTDFTELTASFAIRNGIAHNSDLSLKSPLLRLGGEGDIDIGAGSMDYLAKATLVATAAGQGGKDLSALKGLTVPVRISGPFASLSYKLDFNALIGGAAQQKIDEKKEEIRAKARDKLKEQFKGLFGR